MERSQEALPGLSCLASRSRGASPEQLAVGQGRKWPSSRVQAEPSPARPAAGAGPWCR